MVIKVVDQITARDFLEEAWELYSEAFRDLNSRAVQRHLMYRPEFDEVMHDQRVQKYLCLDDDGTLSGLATYTNDLTAVPLISPEYFARHWPEHFKSNRIWYIGFVAVHPAAQGCEAFAQMVEQMYLVAVTQNGLVGLDICNFNDDTRKMSRVFRAMIRRLTANMQFTRIDQQSYWLYEFPSAA